MTPTSEKANREGLTGYEVVVGVCGGIAAYKVCYLVSRLVQRDAGVTVAMTRAARRFVGPLSFQALTGRRVFTGLWHAEQHHDPEHLRLTESADLFVIAPATANMIAKCACGIADDLVTTMVIGAECPILMAPAMNPRMWANPIVQANVAKLKELGFEFIGPEAGWMACREVGIGRMSEPDTILQAVADRLCRQPPRGPSQ